MDEILDYAKDEIREVAKRLAKQIVYATAKDLTIKEKCAVGNDYYLAKTFQKIMDALKLDPQKYLRETEELSLSSKEYFGLGIYLLRKVQREAEELYAQIVQACLPFVQGDTDTFQEYPRLLSLLLEQAFYSLFLHEIEEDYLEDEECLVTLTQISDAILARFMINEEE